MVRTDPKENLRRKENGCDARAPECLLRQWVSEQRGEKLATGVGQSERVVEFRVDDRK
jgi:hypothetical protein